MSKLHKLYFAKSNVDHNASSFLVLRRNFTLSEMLRVRQRTGQMKLNFIFVVVILLLLSLQLTACGGAGVSPPPPSSASTPSQTPVSTNTAVSTNIPASTPTPTATEVPNNAAVLEAIPTSFNANNDCDFDPAKGWTCHEDLSNSEHNQNNLSWSTSSNVSGVNFQPSSGVLSPGEKTTVTISIANRTCPATANFYFKGPVNTVTVPWSCDAPTIAVNPTSLDPSSCTSLSNANYQCTVTLSDDEGGANWTSSSDVGATFDPASGTVHESGEKITITVGCLNGTLSFKGPANTATVSWTCTTPSATPTSSFIQTFFKLQSQGLIDIPSA